jgi:hypothetical protein
MVLGGDEVIGAIDMRLNVALSNSVIGTCAFGRPCSPNGADSRTRMH